MLALRRCSNYLKGCAPAADPLSPHGSLKKLCRKDVFDEITSLAGSLDPQHPIARDMCVLCVCAIYVRVTYVRAMCVQSMWVLSMCVLDMYELCVCYLCACYLCPCYVRATCMRCACHVRDMCVLCPCYVCGCAMCVLCACESRHRLLSECFSMIESYPHPNVF